MDDETAFLELVRGNNQGELKPLEIGLHALHYVEMSNKWNLSNKGLKGYAQEVKKAASTITEVRNAAKVFHQIRLTEFDIDLPSLYDKATHLLQISKAPESDWPWLVSELLKEEWSVKDTEAAVKAVSTIGDIPTWLTSWLDPDKWKRKYLTH